MTAPQAMHVLAVSTPDRSLPDWTSDMVRDVGWNLITTSDYATAIDAAQHNPIDLILLSDFNGHGSEPIARERQWLSFSGNSHTFKEKGADGGIHDRVDEIRYGAGHGTQTVNIGKDPVA